MMAVLGGMVMERAHGVTTDFRDFLWGSPSAIQRFHCSVGTCLVIWTSLRGSTR